MSPAYRPFLRRCHKVDHGIGTEASQRYRRYGPLVLNGPFFSVPFTWYEAAATLTPDIKSASVLHIQGSIKARYVVYKNIFRWSKWRIKSSEMAGYLSSSEDESSSLSPTSVSLDVPAKRPIRQRRLPPKLQEILEDLETEELDHDQSSMYSIYYIQILARSKHCMWSIV